MPQHETSIYDPFAQDTLVPRPLIRAVECRSKQIEMTKATPYPTNYG
jgi:hypothetical protein